MNVPMEIDIRILYELRDDIEFIITELEKINSITEDKIKRCKELGIPEEIVNKFIDILFEDDNDKNIDGK